MRSEIARHRHEFMIPCEKFHRCKVSLTDTVLLDCRAQSAELTSELNVRLLQNVVPICNSQNMLSEASYKRLILRYRRCTIESIGSKSLNLPKKAGVKFSDLIVLNLMT